MELILIILVSYGISNIIVFGSIFESLRDYAMAFNPNFFGKLLTCMMCTPFRVIYLLYYFIYNRWNINLKKCYKKN